MDWLVPIVSAVLDSGIKMYEEALEERINREDVSLQDFYDEFDAVNQNIRSEANRAKLKGAFEVLEDFLIICDPVKGLEVQQLLTLIMSAYMCGLSSPESRVKVNTPHIIQETKKKLDLTIVEAAKRKTQLNYARPACDAFTEAISDEFDIYRAKKRVYAL